MSTITFTKKAFEDLVGKKLSLDEIKEKLPMLGTGMESIDDKEICVEIFPNRPDMLSVQGLARAFSSFLGIKKGLRQYKVKKSDAKIIVDKSVEKYRPCSAAAIVKGVKLSNESIKELMQNQEKLHLTFGRNRKKVALGYYILDKIKFPVYYKAEDPKKIKFQPLHFPKEITGMQILSQHPTGREFGFLLDGFEKFPIYVDSNNKVLSMPPIINSDESGNVVPGTCDLLVECSGFDQEILNLAINMSVSALADLGGEIYSVEIVYPDKKIISPDMSPKEMKLDLNYINKRLGLELNEKQAKECLLRMGYDYDIKTKKVLIPCYRADILHQIDFAEDIAIAYGYNNFEETIPKVATIGEESRIEILKRKIAELLIGLKLTELYTYNISNDKIQYKNICVKNSVTQDIKKPIYLSNSVSEDFNCLRANMIASLLDVLSRNKHNEYPQNVFDIGTVFFNNPSFETGIEEQEHLAVALCDDEADFTRIKQVLDYIFRNLDSNYNLQEINSTLFIEGRSGKIMLGKSELGYIGEISPYVLENFGIEYPVSAFNLNITALLDLI